MFVLFVLRQVHRSLDLRWFGFRAKVLMWSFTFGFRSLAAQLAGSIAEDGGQPVGEVGGGGGKLGRLEVEGSGHGGLAGFGLGLPMVSKEVWTDCAGDFRTLASRCTEHEAAIKIPLALELTTDFVSKRENYTKLVKVLTEEDGSKWRIVSEKPKTSGKFMKLSFQASPKSQR